MNREIKFRAWHKKYKFMVRVTGINMICSNAISIQYPIVNIRTQSGQIWTAFENVELMQYTGLKDKNDVEIYEGDIVICDDEICTIVWDEPYVTYAVSSKENGNDSLGNFEPKDLEVIGNIYQNKELLEVK